jgi:hypothetical protein
MKYDAYLEGVLNEFQFHYDNIYRLYSEGKITFEEAAQLMPRCSYELSKLCDEHLAAKKAFIAKAEKKLNEKQSFWLFNF